ncbi:MAG: hypothetical protein H5T69_14785, partial [Chloroflexi bacterium]|nr:hypothetical protein [Chloroflexota bacterium]
TEKQQAEYTLRGIQMARENWPWAGVFMIWYFRQVGHIPPERADYYFRMVDPDFTPRQVYLAVQDVARREKVASGIGLYQETHPAIDIQGAWQHLIDDTALGEALVRSEQTGDSLTFTFEGTNVDLVTRRWPGAGRLWVTLDGRNLPGLPVDAQGYSYVDLADETLRHRAHVPLVRNASAGEHVLRLTVADPGQGGCIVDALEVLAGDARAFPWLPMTAGGIALVLDGWLLWRTSRRLRFALRGM